MAETTAAAASPSPDTDRRKKQVMLQKMKARNAKEARPATPENQQKESSPAATTRKSTAYVSLRRKQIIEKRRNKMASPPSSTTLEESPVKKNEEKKESSPPLAPPKEQQTTTRRAAPFPEMPHHKSHDEGSSLPPTPQQSQDNVEFLNNLVVEENTSPKQDAEDRNDKVESPGAWDTRSIHEFPPEPAVDPTWDASKTALFTKEQNEDIQQQQAELLEETATEEFSMLQQDSDGTCFAGTTTKPDEIHHATTTNVDCSLDVVVGTKDDEELAQDAARLIGISESEEAPKPKTPAPDGRHEKASAVAVSTNASETVATNQVDCSMDVHVGIDNNIAFATRTADGFLEHGSNDNEENNAESETNTATSSDAEEVDFSATDLNNPLNILKDDEVLLASDQVRSDVADGSEQPDTADAIRLLNLAEQQKRIEQYQSRSEDDSSSAGDGENEGSDDEDFDKEEEVLYISADSEEEEDLARQLSAADVSEIVVDTSGQGATFAAAAASAVRGAGTEDSHPELNNGGLVKTNSSSSGSFKGDSAVGSSVASSSLFGAGVLSVAGTSVVTEGTASSFASKGPIAGLSEPTAPPPPPSTQPPKKKSSKSKSSKKQKPLFMIPPPPPEKLKKWEEDKLRPMKHLQAVADAKAKTNEASSDPEFRFEEDPSTSEYVSLSLMTSISSTHTQDEIETSLAQSLPEEFSTMIASAERKEKDATPKQKNEVDELQPPAILNESQMSHRTQDMSFARSVDATSLATSFALLSPPHVSRTKLDEAAGLAPGNDGVWKEDINVKKKKKKSPLSDKKMAERLAVASSTAARKFEEKYGEVDQEAKVTRSMSSDLLNTRNPAEKRRTKSEDKTEMSYFCSPDMLSATSFCQPPDDAVNNDDDNILSQLSTQAAKTWASMDGSDKSTDPKQRSIFDSSFDDTHHAGMELVGGAFSTWNNSNYAYGSDAGVKDSTELKDPLDETSKTSAEEVCGEELRLLAWLENNVLGNSSRTVCDESSDQDSTVVRTILQSLLQDDTNFNALCTYASANVTMTKPFEDSSDSNTDGSTESVGGSESKSSIHPFLIPTDKSKLPPKPSILAANFISFLNRISLLSGIESPFKEENPFLLDVVNMSLQSPKESIGSGEAGQKRTVQDLIFQHERGEVVGVMRFFYHACGTPSVATTSGVRKPTTPDKTRDDAVQNDTDADVPPSVEETMPLLYKVPTQSPSPFETASWSLPSIVAIVLGFLGDPVAVCRVKMLNHFCNRLIQENEHVIMRDAVRLGGIGMHIRPAFWMWITLEKCGRRTNAADAPRENGQPSQDSGSNDTEEEQLQCITTVLPQLEKQGREGKWHHVIQRDVARAFGNMPPHKTGARLRTDSIVRALVTWGRGRVLSRGVKGGGVSSPTPEIPPPGIEKAKSKPRPATGPPPWERGDSEAEKEENSQGPPNIVSQWSGISPVPSFCSNSGVSDNGSAAARANLANGVTKALEEDSSCSKEVKNSRAIEELALCGNTLTAEMKEGLQNQLGYILHALAAAHEDVGYCQGMDYVVAHLLRVLQDTVRWHSVRGTLSPVIKAQPAIPENDSDERSLTKEIDQAIESSLVVEETVFRVMDTFMTTYSLRHMYWPELRCLKTCCRVFESLIQLKLPVLADHFAYHDLNVGLFALGWFQTLFLYLPSMPSATVCHMWDIWLVERSFKIFFRVGTAILFLSQPILLNHELEGMMTYLNTFPDATLLNPDILIACALQIKVTNRMLAEIERDLTGGY